MNHAFDYCKTPDEVTRKELLNALHQSLMQLEAAKAGRLENLNHQPAIAEARRIMAKAGHIGFENANLYAELKAANVKIDHHESDLYFEISPAALAILDKFPENKKTARPFTSNIDGKQWMDCPFAFVPWWENKTRN